MRTGVPLTVAWYHNEAYKSTILAATAEHPHLFTAVETYDNTLQTRRILQELINTLRLQFDALAQVEEAQSIIARNTLCSIFEMHLLNQQNAPTTDKTPAPPPTAITPPKLLIVVNYNPSPESSQNSSPESPPSKTVLVERTKPMFSIDKQIAHPSITPRKKYRAAQSMPTTLSQ